MFILLYCHNIQSGRFLFQICFILSNKLKIYFRIDMNPYFDYNFVVEIIRNMLEIQANLSERAGIVCMEEKMEQQQPVEKQIDLGVILGILKRNLIWIILVTILFGASTYLYSSFFITKQYSASAMMIVNNKSTEKTTYSTTEMMAAQDLAEVYAIIIKSDTVLQQVIDNLNLNMSYPQLSKCISVSSVNKTQVFKIAMTYRNAEYAKVVVDEIVKVAPAVIIDTVEAGSVKVVSEAKIDNNGNPVSPNLRRNTLIGALIGLVLILAAAFLRELINNKFKTEEDVINTLHVPLIGIIPEVDRKEFK